MDDVQIDALPAVASASLAHVVPAMVGGVSSKLTIAQILASFHVAAAKAVLVDNDELALADSAASWGVKRLSFANLKNSLLTVPLVPNGGNAPVDPDMDTFMTAGWSGRVQFSTTAIAHAPPEAGIFYAFVLYTNGTRLTQILIPYSNIASAHMWIRNISSTSWNAWRRFAFLDEVLPLIGGTLTGALTLSGNPSSALHAATKQYVDAGDATQIGIGQTLQNVTRTVGTVYQNTTPKPIVTYGRLGVNVSARARMSVDNSTWIDAMSGGSAEAIGFAMVVPPLWYYGTTVSGAITQELR